MRHPKVSKPEGPFLVVLCQSLKGVATPVWAKVAENHEDAMGLARHLALEGKPPELRCDPETDSIAVYDLTTSPCRDHLTNAECWEWRRQAGTYQGPRKRKHRHNGDDDDGDTRKIELVGGLKIVDFRNDGA